MSGRIPQSFIDNILNRTDIVDLIDTRVKLRKSGKNYSACCPFHNEKTPSFTVTRDKQFYYCFGCGASGNAISFLMDYERLNFVDAIKSLALPMGLELPTSSDNAPREDFRPLYSAMEKAAEFYQQQLRRHPQKPRAVQYLKGRGLSGEIALRFALGYAPPGWDSLSRIANDDAALKEPLLKTGLLLRHEAKQSIYDAMRDRIIFPIRDFRGRIIAFGGRVLGDDKPKYLNSPESEIFHKGQELYGLYEARQTKLKQLVVVEGYMDVVALAQFGITWAVATLGTATSTAHVERMFRLVDHIVFCFDGDDAGRRAAWRALEATLPTISDGKSIRFLFLPESEDPDSLVRKEGANRLCERLDNAEPLTEFLFRHLSLDLRLDTLEDRARLGALASPLINKVPDSLFKTMLWQRLADETGLDASTLRQPSTESPEPPTAYFSNASPPSRETRRPFARRPVLPAASLPTLCAKAVRMLLQHPESVTHAELQTVIQLPLEGIALLRDIVALLQEYPELSTAALLGAWHGSEEGSLLARLAAEEFLLPSEDIPQEFSDVLHRLKIQAMENRLDRLTQELIATPSLERLQEQIGLKRQLETLKQPRSTH